MNTNKGISAHKFGLLEMWSAARVFLHSTSTEESAQQRLDGCNCHSTFQGLWRAACQSGMSMCLHSFLRFVRCVPVWLPSRSLNGLFLWNVSERMRASVVRRVVLWKCTECEKETKDNQFETSQRNYYRSCDLNDKMDWSFSDGMEICKCEFLGSDAGTNTERFVYSLCLTFVMWIEAFTYIIRHRLRTTV